MKRALIYACIIASTATVATVHAQTYQWKDSSGRTIVSDTPPPKAARDSRSLGTSPPPSVGGNPADAPKTTAEKDLDFKKRQQEGREKTDKDTKEQTAAAEKRDTCERSRRNLSLLESDQAIVAADDKGQRHAIQGPERQQEIERTRRIMEESCK